MIGEALLALLMSSRCNERARATAQCSVQRSLNWPNSFKPIIKHANQLRLFAGPGKAFTSSRLLLKCSKMKGSRTETPFPLYESQLGVNVFRLQTFSQLWYEYRLD